MFSRRVSNMAKPCKMSDTDVASNHRRVFDMQMLITASNVSPARKSEVAIARRIWLLAVLTRLNLQNGRMTRALENTIIGTRIEVTRPIVTRRLGSSTPKGTLTFSNEVTLV